MQPGVGTEAPGLGGGLSMVLGESLGIARLEVKRSELRVLAQPLCG